MKQLNKLQTIAFLAGSVLMVIGVGSYSLMWHQPIACWVFLVGAILFGVIQMLQSYEGTELTIRRLKRIQTLADLLFILAGIVMVDSAYGFFRPAFAQYIDYITYVYNKWVVLLLIAVVLEVYTTHRIDHELSKKNLKE
jgi:hypothetical protein